MKKIFLFILIIVALMPIASKAQEYTLIEPLPCIAGTSTGGNCAVTPTINLNDYIGYVFKFSIALAAFLAVIMIIWGGFQYMTSEAPFLKIEGKNKIGGAIAGLVMILASYLILATIDPRLVEINTSIPPITFCTAANQEGCVDAKDNITSQLVGDLRALSSQTQAKTNSLIAEKQTIQEELAQINKTINDRQQDLGADEEEELLTRKAQLEQMIRAKNVEINKNVATNIGFASYTAALLIINNPKNYGGGDNLTQYTSEPIRNRGIDRIYNTDSPNIIQRNYNTKINEVIANSDKSEAEKSADIQILENQRDFYINQIKEEVELKEIIEKHNTYKALGETGYYVDNSLLLENKLGVYKNNLNDQVKISSSGLSEAEYKLIMQNKVDEITKTLSEPKP